MRGASVKRSGIAQVLALSAVLATAVSQGARWAVTVQMLFDFVLLVGLARVFVLAAKTGRARRAKGL